MSGQVVDFSKSEHQKSLELLPWFLNATLAPTERGALERHLTECAACRRELDALRSLQAAYVASDLPGDVDGALARLLPRLAEQEPAGGSARPARAPRTRRWNFFAGWALALQFGVIAVLGWALFVMQPAPPEYRALGASDAPLRAHGDAIVVFAPRVEVEAMQRLLARAGARVVDGPTAAGGYVVRFNQNDVDMSLEKLRAEPEVRLAERLDQVRAR